MMLNAYKKRPETFKFRVLEYINGSNEELRNCEQKWLNMIKEEELYWTPNIYNKTVKYYNQKKQSSGGNGQANKGKRKGVAPWNKGKTGVQKSWNKGKTGVQKHSLETRKIMSVKKTEYWASKGKVISELHCKHCNKKFKPKASTQSFCSRSCASYDKQKRRRCLFS